MERLFVSDDALPARWRAWGAAVGGPVLLDLAPALAIQPPALDVLSWNLAIGLARLEEALDRARSDRPLIILAQEAFREGEAVPERGPRGAHGGRLRPARRSDIVAFALEHRLSLRYAPSMRNAGGRSDRGNAILATAGLEAAAALPLPPVRQRRIAVAARLIGLPGVTFVSAHLDTPLGFRPGRRRQVRALAAQAVEHAGGEDVVLGADLNALLGLRDPVVRQLIGAGFDPVTTNARAGTFRGTAPWVAHFDHVLVRRAAGRIGPATLRRIEEEDVSRRRRTILGSDHHPLLVRITMQRPE